MSPNPICLALDTGDVETASRLASATQDHVGIFKVGLTSYIGTSALIVGALASLRPVFLDLKLHDIPAQVEGAVDEIAALGATYTTVHAGGGRAMIESAVRASRDRVKILAVTVLTSLDDAALADVGIAGSAADQVLRLAGMALDAGAHGLVCSPLEVAALRQKFGRHDEGGPLLVVPGIRPQGSDAGDQRRTLGPRQALEAGADIIVIGRPITAAADPAAAAAAIRREITGG